MPTQPSDLPPEPVLRGAGDLIPELGGAAEDAPVAPDPSLEVAVEELSETPPVARRDDDAQEIARLRAQVDSLLNDPFDEWVERIQVGGVTATGFERTLSWRVTKPLRMVRTFQIRVQQLGFPGAVGHTARFVKRRLSGRTR